MIEVRLLCNIGTRVQARSGFNVATAGVVNVVYPGSSRTQGLYNSLPPFSNADLMPADVVRFAATGTACTSRPRTASGPRPCKNSLARPAADCATLAPVLASHEPQSAATPMISSPLGTEYGDGFGAALLLLSNESSDRQVMGGTSVAIVLFFAPYATTPSFIQQNSLDHYSDVQVG